MNRWWIYLLVWLLSSFIILIIFLTYYFLKIFFLSFFLPFLQSRVADRVLVPRPGVKPELLRWESRIQDNGPQETSRPHVISFGEGSPRDLCLNTKTQLH